MQSVKNQPKHLFIENQPGTRLLLHTLHSYTVINTCRYTYVLHTLFHFYVDVCFSLEELEGEIIGYSTDSTLDGNYVVGTVAVYSCGQHYALRGESSRLCGGDRAWSKPAPTCDCEF